MSITPRTMTPGQGRTLTVQQFDALPVGDYQADTWKAIPKHVKRTCGDCGWLQAAVSWWCKSSEAIEFRGTNLPGCSKCVFWKPRPPAPQRPLGFWDYVVLGFR